MREAVIVTLARVVLLVILLALPVSGGAADEPQGASSEATPSAPVAEAAKHRTLVIPFPFYNETIGVGVGAGIITEGLLQPRATTVTSVLVGSGTYLGYMKFLNFRLPGTDRIIFEPDFAVARFSDVPTYTGVGNPGFPGERAGSNGSDGENYIESDVDDLWFDLITGFVLPIGQGKESPRPKVVLDRGLYASGDTGGEVWNPLASGRTYFEVTPFLRRQSLVDNNAHTKTDGLEISLRYDNADFRGNPSRGSMQRVWVTRDWGKFDSSAPYTVVGAEVMKYFPLGPNGRARERVVALDAWTVNCLTWDSSSVDDGATTFHRPPAYKGASLGGLNRLRAYPATRFNDQAGLLYTAEYRETLRWNPLKDVTLGGSLQVDWIELVGFAELGRVAPTWDLGTLHSSMKYDGGVGVRVMANNIVVRIDMAVGGEGYATQMFIGHPFPF